MARPKTMTTSFRTRPSLSRRSLFPFFDLVEQIFLVTRAGLEPTTRCLRGSCSTIELSGPSTALYNSLVPGVRIELTTPASSGLRSTTELSRPKHKELFDARTMSFLRVDQGIVRSSFKPKRTLTLDQSSVLNIFFQVVVDPTGLEPVTSALQRRRSTK